jgi:hypothetical protein
MNNGKGLSVLFRRSNIRRAVDHEPMIEVALRAFYGASKASLDGKFLPERFPSSSTYWGRVVGWGDARVFLEM